MNQERIEQLEEQVAHLTRAVDDLSDVVRDQGAQVARLRRLVDQLAAIEAERAVEGGASAPLADQRPPHW